MRVARASTSVRVQPRTYVQSRSNTAASVKYVKTEKSRVFENRSSVKSESRQQSQLLKTKSVKPFQFSYAKAFHSKTPATIFSTSSWALHRTFTTQSNNNQGSQQSILLDENSTSGGQKATSSTPTSYIVEITPANFESFVLQSKVPVILDCYADWCEPCRELTPKLTAAVEQAAGALRLGKLNVDNQADLAQQLQVTNIPAVFAFYDNKLIGRFVGVPKDEDLNDWIDQILKAGGGQNVSRYVEQGNRLLKENNVPGATKVFSDLLQQTNLKAEAIAKAGLARCALADDNLDVAKQLVEDIKAHYQKDLNHPEVKKAIAAVDLALSSAAPGEQEALINLVKENPDNLQARYDLALSFFNSGRYSSALEECFEIIKREKRWQEEAARKLVLKIFDALGPKDELVKEGRKRLSNLWFL